MMYKTNFFNDIFGIWMCYMVGGICGSSGRRSALEVPQKKYLVPVPVPLFKKELVPDTVHV